MIRINNRQQETVELNGKPTAEVDRFVYLASIIAKDGGTDQDVTARVSEKPGFAFSSLRPIWNSSSLSPEEQTLRLFNTNIKSVLLHGSETWRVTKTLTKKVQTFVNKMSPQHLACARTRMITCAR